MNREGSGQTRGDVLGLSLNQVELVPTASTCTARWASEPVQTVHPSTWNYRHQAIARRLPQVVLFNQF
jgi:hypothetical protein